MSYQGPPIGKSMMKNFVRPINRGPLNVAIIWHTISIILNNKIMRWSSTQRLWQNKSYISSLQVQGIIINIKDSKFFFLWTEYKIPGTPSPDGKCVFTYYSSSRKEGTFNSPRHPANYPSNTTCEFTFQANPDEQVRLAFSTFELRSEKNNLTYGWVSAQIWFLAMFRSKHSACKFRCS